MGFPFALLRIKGSGERQRAGSNPLSATSAPGPGGTGALEQGTPLFPQLPREWCTMMVWRTGCGQPQVRGKGHSD